MPALPSFSWQPSFERDLLNEAIAGMMQVNDQESLHGLVTIHDTPCESSVGSGKTHDVEQWLLEQQRMLGEMFLSTSV
jgi:hypothetical protein